jgi:hypothetical protein
MDKGFTSFDVKNDITILALAHTTSWRCVELIEPRRYFTITLRITPLTLQFHMHTPEVLQHPLQMCNLRSEHCEDAPMYLFTFPLCSGATYSAHNCTYPWRWATSPPHPPRDTAGPSQRSCRGTHLTHAGVQIGRVGMRARGWVNGW